jgi:hypothetical protein
VIFAVVYEPAVTAVFASVVALPTDVTSPVRLAFVTTVAAFPTDVTPPVRLAFVVTFPAVKPAAVPVMFVPTKAVGVPRAGVTNVGLVLRTVLPVPVEVVTPVPPLTTGRTPANAATSTSRKFVASLKTIIFLPAATETPKPAAVVLPNTVEL